MADWVSGGPEPPDPGPGPEEDRGVQQADHLRQHEEWHAGTVDQCGQWIKRDLYTV